MSEINNTNKQENLTTRYQKNVYFRYLGWFTMTFKKSGEEFYRKERKNITYSYLEMPQELISNYGGEIKFCALIDKALRKGLDLLVEKLANAESEEERYNLGKNYKQEILSYFAQNRLLKRICDYPVDKLLNLSVTYSNYNPERVVR